MEGVLVFWFSLIPRSQMDPHTTHEHNAHAHVISDRAGTSNRKKKKKTSIIARGTRESAKRCAAAATRKQCAGQRFILGMLRAYQQRGPGNE